MSDEQTTEVPENVARAVAIAAGEIPADPDAKALRARGGVKDYNAKGNRRAHWYRMVWRSGAWEYVSQERLPSGNYLAHERQATVRGDVYPGEILVTHDHGAGLDKGALLVTLGSDGKIAFVDLDTANTRAGLEITLPNGAIVKTPNPRGR